MERLVTHTVDEIRMLRSEILGLRYMYSITKNLLYANSLIEDLANEILVDYELEEENIGHMHDLTEQRMVLLEKINAIDKSSIDGKFFLTKYGRVWFDLLTELNLPIRQMEPLEIITEDIPGKFYNLLKKRSDIVNRIIIVSPWIYEVSLVRRMVRIIEKSHAATLIFSRSPDPKQPKHELRLNLLKGAGATVYVNDNLHSKLYICQTNIKHIRNSFAFLCSANLSRGARFKNIEIGIIIYGFTSKYRDLIENLIHSSYALKGKEWHSE